MKAAIDLLFLDYYKKRTHTGCVFYVDKPFYFVKVADASKVQIYYHLNNFGKLNYLMYLN